MTSRKPDIDLGEETIHFYSAEAWLVAWNLIGSDEVNVPFELFERLPGTREELDIIFEALPYEEEPDDECKYYRKILWTESVDEGNYLVLELNSGYYWFSIEGGLEHAYNNGFPADFDEWEMRRFEFAALVRFFRNARC